MNPNCYWLPGPWKGRMAIAPRPRGGDWLADEIASWKSQSISFVVSFLEPAEIAEFELQSEGELAARNGIRFANFVVHDRGVPASNQEFLHLADQVYRSLTLGENVLIHCRQGIGRSGLLAAVLLMMSGETVENSVRQISQARGVPIPETENQLEWLNRIAPILQGDDRVRLRA